MRSLEQRIRRLEVDLTPDEPLFVFLKSMSGQVGEPVRITRRLHVAGASHADSQLHPVGNQEWARAPGESAEAFRARVTACDHHLDQGGLVVLQEHNAEKRIGHQ